jgi:hypothetical protein
MRQATPFSGQEKGAKLLGSEYFCCFLTLRLLTARSQRLTAPGGSLTA